MSESSLGSLAYGMMDGLPPNDSSSWLHLPNAYPSLSLCLSQDTCTTCSLCEACIGASLSKEVLDNNKIVTSVIITKWV